MTRQVGDSVQAAIEHALSKLLHELAPADMSAQVTLFVGCGSDALQLAQVSREGVTVPPRHVSATTDWPLDAEGTPVGFVRFGSPGAVHEDVGAGAHSQATALLARNERVTDIVASLADLTALAEYFRMACRAAPRRD